MLAIVGITIAALDRPVHEILCMLPFLPFLQILKRTQHSRRRPPSSGTHMPFGLAGFPSGFPSSLLLPCLEGKGLNPCLDHFHSDPV
jgi:hypothetical protein